VSAVAVLIGAALILAAIPRAAVISALRSWRAAGATRSALPALIDAIAAALAAGLSLELAFSEVAPTLPGPLARATANVSASLRIGEPIERALAAYDGVVSAAELAPFVIVLGAFARSGGRVGRSLARVARLLRGRLALDAERSALTAQGRLSATVLVALAPIGALFFGILTPSYLVTLAGPGRALGALAVALDFNQGEATFPFGAHVAVVEVDLETGRVEQLRHIAVDDCGRIINPLLVAGQQHGGIAQGIAQALFEEVVYDLDGNPLTASLMDYSIPSAAEFPSFEASNTVTPTPLNPLGAKGIGESGTVGSTPAVHNAVIDAVSHLGVRHIDMPLTPERVWRAIQDAPA